jgi:hypothetical protein
MRPKPCAHLLDFWLLSGDDFLCQGSDLRIGTVFQQHQRHFNRPKVMRNHSANEVEIRIPGESDVHGTMHPVVHLAEGPGRGRFVGSVAWLPMMTMVTRMACVALVIVAIMTRMSCVVVTIMIRMAAVIVIGMLTLGFMTCMPMRGRGHLG